MNNKENKKAKKAKPEKKISNFAFEGKTTPLTKISLHQGANDIYQMYMVPKQGKETFERDESYIIANAFRKEILRKYGNECYLAVSIKDKRFGWRRSYYKRVDDEAVLWSASYDDTGGAPDGAPDEDDAYDTKIEALCFYVMRKKEPNYFK